MPSFGARPEATTELSTPPEKATTFSPVRVAVLRAGAAREERTGGDQRQACWHVGHH